MDKDPFLAYHKPAKTSVVLTSLDADMVSVSLTALERRGNPEFSDNYFNGLWQSIWWAVVTVTTVGYGDKTPKGKMGRFLYFRSVGSSNMSKIIRIFHKQRPKRTVVIPDDVSFKWLWQILPVEYWLLLITLLGLAFVFGIVFCYFFIL